MSPVPFSCNEKPSKDDCVLDLGSLVDDTDMDCDLPEEDFLQQLSSDLEIPMLLEESLSSDREIDSLFGASSFFREFDWDLDPVFHKSPDTIPQVSLIKEEVMLEQDATPLSPSNLSHDSWSSNDTKQNILETPPISPPQSSSGSPPRTPTPPAPPTRKEPPVIMVGGKPIKIVPLKQNAKIGDNKTTVVLPRPRSVNAANVILPRPLTVNPLLLNNGKKPIVLSPNEFNALTNQIAVTKSPAPTEIRIVSPLNTVSPPTVKIEPGTERQDIQIKALKRQQRMIKNRESACLSRKKKKEYITSLESRISDLEKENMHLKLENKSLRSRLGLGQGDLESDLKRPKTVLTVNVKKTAILAVLLMVSVNLGSLSLLTRGRPDADTVLSVPVSLSHHSGRRLLWAEADLQNISSSSSSSYSQQPTCPLHINQTESLRLDSELRRWIGADSKPTFNNGSGPDSDDLLPTDLPKTDSRLVLRPPPPPLLPRPNRKLLRKTASVQELQVVGPHAGLLEALHRRDDTFYVVSFSGDHLLLPALAHNNSVRPKMSLVLPALAFNTSEEASVTMMQIDCEVLDTRLVELSERDIPPHLRQAKAPAQHNTRHKNVSTEEEPVRNSYRPYFMRPSNLVDPYSGVPRGPRERPSFP